MLAKVTSYGIGGLDAYPVTIEIDVTKGLPATVIVGLPDNAIRESKERVRSAIKNIGYQFGPKRITVNLSPADVKKEGPSFDLAIAVGILAATGQINSMHLKDYAFLGELSLDGRIQPVSGTLSAALAFSPEKFKGLILPVANSDETAIAENTPVYPMRTLSDVIEFLNDPSLYKPYRLDVPSLLTGTIGYDIDFSDVKGQAHVKRGLEIAASGNHNVLLIGPPGSGKSMLAKRLPTILPDMDLSESLETTKIHSVMGLLKSNQGIVAKRPFRSPHHTTSDVAIVGGGSIPKPGEVTLSHNGILFLDELPEFNRNVLESLRQPLEDHCVTVARAHKTLRFPSRFMLVCAMNPCMCGQFGNPRVQCHCNALQIQKYRSKISGPLLDRIDIHLDVPPVPFTELRENHPSETSAQIKERVVRARAVQAERFKNDEGITASAKKLGGCATFCGANAHMSHRQIKKYCGLGKEENELLKQAMDELNFSARAHDKILKVARTIADLDRKDEIKMEHLAEAIQYRSLDWDWWA